MVAKEFALKAPGTNSALFSKLKYKLCEFAVTLKLGRLLRPSALAS